MGGRGGSSGIGPTSKAMAALPDYDTKAMAKRMEAGGPALAGSPGQVARADDARYEAQYTMLETVMSKNRIGADVLQDISDGKAAMQKGVEAAYSTAIKNYGTKSVAQEHAERKAKTYNTVANDLKKIDTVLQQKTSASWWLSNQNQTAFRKYIESGKSISEMEKDGWFRKK